MTSSSTERPSFPVRAVRYAWRRGHDVKHALRGKYILHRYTSHYRQARRAYASDGRNADGALGPLYDIGVRVIPPRAPDNPIALPLAYDALVSRVARSAAEALERSTSCHFFPRLPEGPIPARTSEIAAVVSGEVITIQLLEPFAIEGLHELCEPLLRELERTVYGSYTIADKVYIYRNPVSHQIPRTSWRWHFDNHPREILKVMVYLTDVSEDTAPFQYLREPTSGRPLPGTPLLPLFGDSRVPTDEIDRRLAGGWTCHSVTGPRGTIVVFDDNVVHRATLGKTGHRDVVVFQVRPAPFRATRHIDARWTGSFNHCGFNRDPWTLAQGLRV